MSWLNPRPTNKTPGCAHVFIHRRSSAIVSAPWATRLVQNWADPWLKSRKQPTPAHQPRVKQGVGIGVKSFAHLTRLPSVLTRLYGHINHHRRADDIGLGHKAPVPAIPRIFAIIAKNEVAARGNGNRAEVVDRVRRIMAVRLADGFAVNEDAALADLYAVSGHSDQALDEIFIAVRKRRMEDDHLLAARFAPEADVITRKQQPDVVAEPAHEQMIADEQRALHGSGGNHAGLHHRAGNQEKRERHPNPGEQFANQTLAEGIGVNGRRTRSAGGGQLRAGGKIGSRVRAYRAGSSEIIVHGTFLIQ